MGKAVDLGEELEAVVEEVLDGGHYASRDEIIREGVRLVALRERELAELDAAIAEGIADADAGRVEDIEVVAQRLKNRYANWGEQSAR
jgi:antitoxin ParD1/3/4